MRRHKNGVLSGQSTGRGCGFADGGERGESGRLQEEGKVKNLNTQKTSINTQKVKEEERKSIAGTAKTKVEKTQGTQKGTKKKEKEKRKRKNKPQLHTSFSPGENFRA